MIFPLLLALSVFFSPKGGCEQAVIDAVKSAKTTVLVQAYTFTSQPIAAALIADKLRGVDVRVILDKNWQTQSAKVEFALIAAGVPVLIDSKHSIAHNKVVVIDNYTVVTGSFNFTWQAEHSNAENLLIVNSKALGAKYAANWQVHAAHSNPP
jgi:phosphatidylserine/phosphatidylglycerophosphate/cardiolipin synthase-like enzyme